MTYFARDSGDRNVKDKHDFVPKQIGQKPRCRGWLLKIKSGRYTSINGGPLGKGDNDHWGIFELRNSFFSFFHFSLRNSGIGSIMWNIGEGNSRSKRRAGLLCWRLHKGHLYGYFCLRTENRARKTHVFGVGWGGVWGSNPRIEGALETTVTLVVC